MMNRIFRIPRERFQTVNRVSDNIEHSTLYLVSHRHTYRRACSHSLQPALKTISIIHGDSSHSILTDMLLHFGYQFAAIATDDI